MPLTTAHPLITWPIWRLSRRWLDLPALIVGSTIPDITYFLHLRTMANIGHSGYGIIIQGIPAALCLLLIFSFVMLQPLRALSPGGIGRLLPEAYPFFPATRLAVIILSIFIGAWSHVFWDSFTHNGWFFMRNIPGLDTQIGPLRAYKYLQYTSGVLGTLGVIIWAIRVTRQRPPARERIANRVVPVALILGIVVVTTYFALGKNNPLTPYIVLIQTTIGLIAGTYLGLLAFSIIDRLRPFRRV